MAGPKIFAARHGLLLGGFLIVTILCEGCCFEKKPGGLPKLRSCTITITQEGKPAEGISIMLAPTSGRDCPWAVTGNTNSSGVARIVTHGKYGGAPEGQYKIMLSKQDMDGFDPNSLERPSAAKPMIIYSLIDTQYTDLNTSPLTIEVGRHGANESFEIGPAVREQIDVIAAGP